MSDVTFNPVWAVRDAENAALTHKHKALLYALASRLPGPDEEAWPSIPLLAKNAGMGERQCKETLAELVSWCVVKRRVVSDRRGRHNRYRIDFDVLACVEPFTALPRRKRPAPMWLGSDGARPMGEAEGAPMGEAEGAPMGEAEGAPMGEAEGAPMGEAEGGPVRSQWKRPEEETKGRHHDLPGGAPPSAPLPRGGSTSAGVQVERGQRGEGDPAELGPLPGHGPEQPSLFASEGLAKAGNRSGKQSGPRKQRPEAPSAPVREAYVEAYTAAFGVAPTMGAVDNTAAKRLVDKMGAEPAVQLIRDAFSGERVRERYSTILKIAADPAAVRAALSSASACGGLTRRQLDFARQLVRRYPAHPVSAAVMAERRPPTFEEFEALVAEDKRPRRHGPPRQEQPADGPHYQLAAGALD